MKPPGTRWRSWRAAWIELHSLFGLFLTGYLLIYAVSALAFNHPDWFPERPPNGDEAGQTLRARSAARHVPDGRHAAVHGAELRDQLGLIGDVPYYRAQFLNDGRLRFELVAPGRSDVVDLLADGSVKLRSERRGIWSVLEGLHGNYGLAGAAWMSGWKLWTNLSVVGLVFAVPSGLWLWWPHRSPRNLGLVLLAGSTLACAIAVGAVW